MDKRLILVAGSSRSGTSVFSGVLGALGASIPQPEVAPDESNPRGFSEPKWVVEFHSRLLRAANVHVGDARPSAWARTAEIGGDRQPRRELERWLRRQVRQADRALLVKDPRLSWFLPLWERVGEPLAPVRFATVLRHPAHVLRSQQTYYVPWNENSRAAGWLNTMLFTERATRGRQRAFVRFDDLLDDPMVVLGSFGARLDVDLVDRMTTPRMREINQLIDPGLRRSAASWESLQVDARLVDLAEETWTQLSKLADAAPAVGEEAGILGELDELRREYVRFYELAESVTEFTQFAVQRSTNLATRIGNRWAPNQPPVTTAMLIDKARRKVTRRARRLVHRARGSGQAGG